MYPPVIAPTYRCWEMRAQDSGMTGSAFHDDWDAVLVPQLWLLVDWLSLMKTADAKICRPKALSHLFQQLDKKSQTRYGFPRHISMVSPFRHSLVGYWPSLALVKSSSAFVKREVARLLQFHSHERSYSGPTAKTCPIYCHMLPKNCATTLLDTRSPLPKYLADLKFLNCQLQNDIIQSNPSSDLADLIKSCCLSIQIVHPLPMFSSPTSSSIYDANNRVVTYLTACCGGFLGRLWQQVMASQTTRCHGKEILAFRVGSMLKMHLLEAFFARYLVSRSWICGLSLWHCVLYKATISPASTQSLPAVPSSLLRRAVKKHVSPVWPFKYHQQHIS